MIQEIAIKNDSKLLITCFPRSVQLDLSHYPLFRKIGLDVDEKMVNWTAPQDHLWEFSKKNDVDFLDLMPIFQENGKQLYLRYDDHLNKAGNTLSANEIVSKILFIEARSKEKQQEK